MVWFWAFGCWPLAYLLTARGTYGLLKWQNRCVVETWPALCDCGYACMHEHLSCHRSVPDEAATHRERLLWALGWPAIIIIGLIMAAAGTAKLLARGIEALITGGWGR